MSSDPVMGFGERITKRARLPCTTIVAIPGLILIFGGLLTLVNQGVPVVDAIKEVRETSWLVLSPAVILPAAVFAIFRELQLHEQIEKLLSIRKAVAEKIAGLMADLARECGYDHHDRIVTHRSDAMDWFYFHINRAGVTRDRAFEVWEGLYVNLYVSLACLISVALCIYLALASGLGWIWWSISIPALLFLAFWIHRRTSIVPRIMRIPEQQVRDIQRSSEILAQARSRFGQ